MSAIIEVCPALTLIASCRYSRRGVAQPGRAPGSGPGGRRFKSSLPDQLPPIISTESLLPMPVRNIFHPCLVAAATPLLSH